jgi:hypothetical protein
MMLASATRAGVHHHLRRPKGGFWCIYGRGGRGRCSSWCLRGWEHPRSWQAWRGPAWEVGLGFPVRPLRLLVVRRARRLRRRRRRRAIPARTKARLRLRADPAPPDRADLAGPPPDRGLAERSAAAAVPAAVAVHPRAPAARLQGPAARLQGPAAAPAERPAGPRAKASAPADALRVAPSSVPADALRAVASARVRAAWPWMDVRAPWPAGSLTCSAPVPKAPRPE